MDAICGLHISAKQHPVRPVAGVFLLLGVQCQQAQSCKRGTGGAKVGTL